MSYKTHTQGLAGFWDKLKNAIKTIATVVGAAIGGPVGAYVGSIAGEGLSSWINGRPFDLEVFDPTSGFLNGISPALRGSKTDDQIKDNMQEGLIKWHNKEFAPWVKNYIKKINTDKIDINDKSYIKRFNEVLVNFEALRIYYKSIYEVNIEKGMNGIDLDFVIDIENAKTKSGIIAEYIKAFKLAYLKANNDKYNVTPTYSSINFTPQKYEIDYIKPITWNGVESNSKIHLLDWKGVNPKIKYKEETSINDNKGGVENEPKEPSQPKLDIGDLTVKIPTTQKPKSNNASLLFVGSIAAGLIARNLLNSSNNSKSK